MTMNFDIMALTLVLPLLGALCVGTLGQSWNRSASAAVASGAVGSSFLIVLCNIVSVFRGDLEPVRSVDLWNWMSLPTASGMVDVNFGLYLDPLSLTLMAVITGVGFLIHVFSTEYMKTDPQFTRFFCLLNVFIAAMTLLVLANNFATLIIGWGGVGFASFGLIGFWREKPSAAAASKKAFVMNVIGDVGLMVAVFVLFKRFGALDFQTLFSNPLGEAVSGDGWLTCALLGLLVGAYAKSAQLPLHTWLPDAMEGPTPVSALIHAATMVTAGVYLLVRCHPLFELHPSMMMMIACLGAITSLFAACCALVQNDLKRVLAYSTMSQLGYMFLAVGVGAYGAAIFHLVTHAFFKALLFLTAGMVIHTAHGEQDMRRLGGLKKDIPLTCLMFGVGAAALAGVPGTAGYFSKEAILHATHHHEGAMLLFVIGALVAILTAFYTGRAFSMTFLGESKIENPHLPGAATTISCLVLTVFALFSGWAHEIFALFLEPLKASSTGFVVEPHAWSGAALAIGGTALAVLLGAIYMYWSSRADKLGRNTTGVNFVRQGFGVDQTFEVWSDTVRDFGRLMRGSVDELVSVHLPALMGSCLVGMGSSIGKTQTGYVRNYMVSILISILVLVCYALILKGGAFL